MNTPLSAETITRMKAEHRADALGNCWKCWRDGDYPMPRPCDAALLLAELERREQVDVGSGSHCHCGRDGMEPAHPRHDG